MGSDTHYEAWRKENPETVRVIQEWAHEAAHGQTVEELLELWPWIREHLFYDRDAEILLRDELEAALIDVATDWASYLAW